MMHARAMMIEISALQAPACSTPVLTHTPAAPAPTPSAFQMMMVAARDRRLAMASGAEPRTAA
jgi:hypothetical protein